MAILEIHQLPTRTRLNEEFNFSNVILPTTDGENFVRLDDFLYLNTGYYNITKLKAYVDINLHNFSRTKLLNKLKKYKGKKLVVKKAGNQGGTLIHPILIPTLLRAIEHKGVNRYQLIMDKMFIDYMVNNPEELNKALLDFNHNHID